ncbi:protein CHUP1, chloroplastic [Nymphaea colorata]|nr:protein CHUP1, chloroplastic [Nymphaea colorata]
MSSVKSPWHASLNGYPCREPSNTELTERCQMLEKQNEHLRQEVVRLKSQISGLLKDRKGNLLATKQDIPAEFPTASRNGLRQKGDCNLVTGHASVLMPVPAPVPPPPPTKPRTPESSIPTLGSLMAAAVASAKSSKVEQPSPSPSPPPPPPPPSMKSSAAGDAEIRRLPEVVQLYHWMTKKEARRGVGGAGNVNARDMIGEIENRSAHLLAIKTDVETKGDFVNSLIRKVEKARFSRIEEVEDFIRWLDKELSQLVDERAVLKHFQWPENKTDAMREVAFNYRELINIAESQSCSTYNQEARQPIATFLKQMQASQEKVEQGVYNIQKVRDGAIKRCKEFGIPWEWMLDTGIVSQLKMSSVKIAKGCMKRVTAELKSMSCTEGEDLMLQAVRFAFRVHQFVGGFDGECACAFQEMRNMALNECQLHQHSLPQSRSS